MDCVRAKLVFTEGKLVAGVCHGSEDKIVGQHGSLLMAKDGETAGFCRRRFVWMLSCLAGAELLPWMVQRGAISTMGYKDKFIFCISGGMNGYAEPFFRSHFAGVQALLKGKTAKEAYEETIKTFEKYLDDPNIPEKIKPYLLHDKDCCVYFGDPNAKLEPKPEPEPWYIKVQLEPEQEGETIKDCIVEVVDPSNNPVKGAVVKLEGKESKITRIGRTGDDGKTRLKDVPEGKYTLTVTAPSFKKLIKKVELRD